MATTPMRSPRIRRASSALVATRRLVHATALLVVLSTMLLPATVAAAPATAANYRLDAVRYHTGTAVGSCRGWGGDTDDAGNFYMACPVMRDLDGNGSGDVMAPALYEMDLTGMVQRIGWLPSEYAFDDISSIRDVGVSPDGTFAYVSVGPPFDNLGVNPNVHPRSGAPLANGATAGSVLRLARQPDGSWLHDPTWKAGPFLIGGNYWSVRYVDVDASGRVYVTVNSYVYELSPTTGQQVSAFGGATTAYPGGPWVEGFETPQGLAVAADGQSILIVEQQHQIVQRWRRIGATDWTRDTSLLLGVPSQVGDYCGTTTHFQSPYDVATDAAGDIYVMDTTCQRIQRFTSAGAFVQTVWTNVGGDDMNHGIAVNWQGSILLPIEEDLLVRLDPPQKPSPAPAPTCQDAAAPQIAAIASPASSTTRRVTIEATASDDCGATHVRVLGQRAGAGAWIPGLKLVVPLAGWNGRKSLVVQVKDGAGRIAGRRVAVTLALPQPTLRARASINLPGRGCSPVDPMRRVSGVRLLDRCARITGRALQVQRRGAGQAIRMLLPVGLARSLYANAVGPVEIWVVTDATSRVSGRIAKGRTLVVDGSLVADRNGRTVHAIPVDRLSGR
jgi:hypothetical protein